MTLPYHPAPVVLGYVGHGTASAVGSGAADVLLLDAGMRQMLVATRSLGRAGIRVALSESFTEYDEALPVPSYFSRWATSTTRLPDFQADPDGFTWSVLEYARQSGVQVVIPGSDGAIAALR